MTTCVLCAYAHDDSVTSLPSAPESLGAGLSVYYSSPRCCDMCCSFFIASSRWHTTSDRDWSSDVCSSDLTSFFFFQAEDGIRDLIVTGVQTCALPIYGERGHVQDPHRGRPVVGLLRGRVAGGALRAHGGDYVRGTEDPDPLAPRRRAAQIGRASCRERV